MRLKLGIGSKAKKPWSSSSLKGKTLDGGEDSAWQLDTKNTGRLGSKDDEEAFFDSQTSLDSDCEDDFVSVNGDLVPSRGSTPNNHQINADGPLQVLDNISSSNASPESKSQSSATDGKRSLAELLKESQVAEQNHSNEQSKVNGQPGTNIETPKQDLNHHNERKMKSKRCCLPSLVHILSFRERRSRKTYS